MTLSRRTAPACLTAAVALSLVGASAAVAGPPGSSAAGAGVAHARRPLRADPGPADPGPADPGQVRTTPEAGTPLPGQYVVVFRPGTRGAEDLARTLGSRAYDRLHARIHSTGGALLGTLVTRSNTSKRDVWLSEQASLAAWAGRTVSVRFVATTDGSYPSSLFVDDVSLA